MTYETAQKQLDNNSRFRIGELFFIRVANQGYGVGNYPIEEIIISPLSNWREVRHEKYLMSNDNKKALESLGLMNDKLEVILISDPNNVPIIQSITDQLNLVAQ